MVKEGDWDEMAGKVKAWLEMGAPRPVSGTWTAAMRYDPAAVAARHMDIYHCILESSR